MGEVVAAEMLRAMLTDKGLAAATQAATLGKPVKITHVGVTGTPGTPSENMETLPGEVGGRLAIADGRVISSNQVNVSALLPDTFPTVDITGLGFYLADGTLFSVYLSKTPLLNHVQGATLLIGMDFVLDNIPADSVVVESTGANLIMGDWVPVYRRVNGKALTADIMLNAADVNAAPSGFGLGQELAASLADMNSDPEGWNGGATGWFRTTTSTLNIPDNRTGMCLLQSYAKKSSKFLIYQAGADIYTRFYSASKGWGDWSKSYSTTNPPPSADLSGHVPVTRKVNNKALDKDITLNADDVGAAGKTHEHAGYVKDTRKVNSKPLSADINLNASDVGAVPTTRKINNRSLDKDLTLNPSDIGAVSLNTSSQTIKGPNSVWLRLNAENQATEAGFGFQRAGLSRWGWWMTNQAEDGSNEGSNFLFRAYDDNGGHLGNILSVKRATQVLDFIKTPTVGGNQVYHKGNRPTFADVGAYPYTGGRLNGSLTAEGGEVRAERAVNPLFEWHAPGKHAWLSYLPDNGGLIMGSSNGAGTLAAQAVHFRIDQNDFRGRLTVSLSQSRGWHDIGSAAFYAQQNNVSEGTLLGMMSNRAYFSGHHNLEHGYGSLSSANPELDAHVFWSTDGGGYLKYWQFQNGGGFISPSGWAIGSTGMLTGSCWGGSLDAWIALYYAQKTPNAHAVGSYIFAQAYPPEAIGLYVPGSHIPGQYLRACSCDNEYDDFVDDWLPGTWQCMGMAKGHGTGEHDWTGQKTLWLRIA